MTEDVLQQIERGEIAYEHPDDGMVAVTYITEDLVVQKARSGHEEQMRKGVFLTDYLHAQGVAVPDVREVHEDPFYVVFEKIDATPLMDREAFTEDDYVTAVKQAGAECARMHEVEAFGYGRPDSENGFRSGEYGSWRVFTEHYVEDTQEYVQSDPFRPVAEQAASRVDVEKVPENPPKRVLHMDYTLDNILVDDDLNVHIIDLDNAYYGDARFDLMYADLSMSKHGDRTVEAFWEGYRSVRDPGLTPELEKTYQALAILHSTKAGEWCLRNDKQVNVEQWQKGLQHRLDRF